MIRLTTPTHTFTLPFSTSTISSLIATYQQNGATVIEKELEDVTLDGNKVIITLTQEETKKFEACRPAFVQLRIKNTSDAVLASNIVTLDVQPVLNSEVM